MDGHNHKVKSSKKNMTKDVEVETTTYRNGAQQVVPVTVVSDSDHSSVRGRGCVWALGVLEILLGLAVIAIESACVGLWYFPEGSAVGIYVGIFTLITGIITVLSARRRSSDGMRKCCFITDVIANIFCALKTFALFCASAAMLATALTWYYNNRSGIVQGPPNFFQTSVGSFVNNFIPSNNFITQNVFPNPGLYGNTAYYSSKVSEVIGLKAALMTLYFLLFIIAILASGFSCWNCCRARKERQMVMTVYPNRHTVGQHKV